MIESASAAGLGRVYEAARGTPQSVRGALRRTAKGAKARCAEAAGRLCLGLEAAAVHERVRGAHVHAHGGGDDDDDARERGGGEDQDGGDGGERHGADGAPDSYANYSNVAAQAAVRPTSPPR